MFIDVQIPEPLASRVVDEDGSAVPVLLGMVTRAWRAAHEAEVRGGEGARYVVAREDEELRDDSPETELLEVTLGVRSYDPPPLRPGTQLVVPDRYDLSTVRGVKIEDIGHITLDGRTWIDIIPQGVVNVHGVGKTLLAEIGQPEGKFSRVRGISVPNTSIVAVGW